MNIFEYEIDQHEGEGNYILVILYSKSKVKKPHFLLLLLLLTFIYIFFCQCIAKPEDAWEKTKKEKLHVAMSVQKRWKESNDPLYKKVRHIVLKLILIKYHSKHVKLNCASTIWFFKVSNFIFFNSIYWIKKKKKSKRN